MGERIFFCVAVNLLELGDLKLMVRQIEMDEELSGLPIKEWKYWRHMGSNA